MRPTQFLSAFAVVAALVTAIFAPAAAQEEPVPADTAPVDPPALVVAISVDQFSADLFAQYRQHFTGGFARLLQGAVFPSGFQSHAATETCPGHSTILTGVHPARSGIVANNWYDPGLARADKRIYCAEDETDPASSSSNPVVSAGHLKVPTLGEWLKRASPNSRNVAVSGKDRAAMMMGGHDIDAAYWWKGSGFVTFKGRTAGKAAQALNGELAKAIAAGAPALDVPEWCVDRDRSVQVGNFTIGTNRFAIPPGQAGMYHGSPHLDAATEELAERIVDEERLGQYGAPDVLSISFSATDYIGHAFGTEGVEMCIQLAELDRTIARLFEALDARGIDYVAVLTADHGGIDAPERLNEQGYPQAQRLTADLETGALAAAVTRKTGISAGAGPLLMGEVGGDIYLSNALSARDKARATAALAAMLGKHPQVAGVFTAEDLAAMPVPSGSPQDWTLAQRVRASFDKAVSGDLTVVLKRGVVPVHARPGITTTHGSPWDYDRRVPILFWRKGLAGLEQPAPVETVDIAPTLAALLHLDVPQGAFDGRCLDIDGGTGNICGQ